VRRRILLLVAGAITVVVLAFAMPLALLVRHVVYQDATASLRDEANRIANYLHSSYIAPTRAELRTYLAGLPGDRDASVALGDGTVVGTPPPGSASELPAVQGFVSNGDGHTDGGGEQHQEIPPEPTTIAYHGGQLTQLPVLDPERGGGEQVVRVYASDGALHSDEAGWWLLLGLSSLGLLLLGIGAAELLTRRLVRPLVRTAQTAHRITAGDITARAPTDGPREIAEVGQALNRLGERVDELIAEERETVADLSHRLRTPLTALRLDAESLRDPDEAERVGAHVTALERMLTAVIHAARRPQREGRMPVCDATAVVTERIRFWSALAEDQGRAVTVDLPESALPVRAAGEDLAAAVDALLENVVAHTPEGTPVRVSLHGAADASAVLQVADDGPGIGDDATARGRSDRGSTGLGLDIARRCAQLSGGAMTIGRSESGGALVTLRLGPAAAAPDRAGS
jgi:signal transduction histidine kinase